MKPLILIMTGDVEFYLLASHMLSADGFKCIHSSTFDDLFRAAHETRPRAVLVDCTRDTLEQAAEVCSTLKSDAIDPPMIMIAVLGRASVSSTASLKQAGFDEIAMRPVVPSQVLEFLAANLRDDQTSVARLKPRTVLTYADVEMNVAKRRVRRGGLQLKLPQIEFKILRALLGSPERVFSRDELVALAWPSRVFVEPRTVDVHVGRLRKLLMRGGGPDLIRTVRAAGYAIDRDAGEDGVIGSG